MNDKLDDLARMLIAWCLADVAPAQPVTADDMDDEIVKETFLGRIMLNKLNVFGCPITIHPAGLVLLEICAEGAPAVGQMIYAEILEKVGPVKPGYKITNEDFINTFPNQYPDCRIPSVLKKYEDLWMAQKAISDDGREFNTADTPDFWRKYFILEGEKDNVH